MIIKNIQDIVPYIKIYHYILWLIYPNFSLSGAYFCIYVTLYKLIFAYKTEFSY